MSEDTLDSYNISSTNTHNNIKSLAELTAFHEEYLNILLKGNSKIQIKGLEHKVSA